MVGLAVGEALGEAVGLEDRLAHRWRVDGNSVGIGVIGEAEEESRALLTGDLYGDRRGKIKDCQNLRPNY